ncbi:MAG: TIGR04255 family protein [Candidatus Thiodiazotropha sp. (ex Notomyrtea botanica)]|nr:TIGR04255 family protein [Candidatus Thiodiazotropha sp. (ex Notomyrtea botanica)]
MGKIKNSPLVEAIFELRWGEIQPGKLSFPKEESDFFPGIFSQSVRDMGFSYYEQVNSGEIRPALPFDVKHRFRQSQHSWPCFQIGLGIFTANQIGNLSVESGDDEYDWVTFKPFIMSGLTALDKSYPSGLENLARPKANLRYQDGFILEEGETLESFVSNKIKADLKIAHVFTDEPSISDSCKDIKLDITYETKRPQGSISISLISALIHGQRGIVIDTSVISDFSSGDLSVELFDQWCEESHDLQRHTFNTLIRTSDLKG